MRRAWCESAIQKIETATPSRFVCPVSSLTSFHAPVKSADKEGASQLYTNSLRRRRYQSAAMNRTTTRGVKIVQRTAGGPREWKLSVIGHVLVIFL